MNKIFYNHDQKRKLYHSMYLENVSGILLEQQFKARTTQWYFPKGYALKDDHPNYEKDSNVMIGWSMTRDPLYAATWKDVVFEFDEELIRNRFKIQQIAWNYTIKGEHFKDHKKEKESFVVATKTGKTWKELRKGFDILMDQAHNLSDKGDNSLLDELNGVDSVFDLLKKGQPKVIPLRFCAGIYLSNVVADDIDNKQIIDDIKNTGLFKGVFDEEKTRKLVEEQSKSVNKIIMDLNHKKRTLKY